MTSQAQATTLSRLIAEDCELGHYVSAKEHLTDLSVIVDELELEQSMRALDRRIAEMETADLEEALQGSWIK